MGYKKPLEVKIQLTEKCNFDCWFCFNRQGLQQKKQMPLETAKKTISKISEEGIEKVRFTGGEPLLFKGLQELLSLARKKGLSSTLNTNASLINEKNSKAIAENADTVLISMHSLPAKKTAKAAEQLSKGKCSVKAATILTEQNIKNLEKFHETTAQEPFTQWVLLRQIPNALNKNPVSRKAMQAAIEKIEAFNRPRPKKDRFLIENALPLCCFFPERASRVCLGAIHEDGHSSLFVDTSATIKPSYFFDLPLGNALSTALLDAWNSDFMKRMNSLEFIPEICHNCKFVLKCMAGSRFSAFTAKKSLYALDPLADPNQFIKGKKHHKKV